MLKIGCKYLDEFTIGEVVKTQKKCCLYSKTHQNMTGELRSILTNKREEALHFTFHSLHFQSRIYVICPNNTTRMISVALYGNRKAVRLGTSHLQLMFKGNQLLLRNVLEFVPG